MEILNNVIATFSPSGEVGKNVIKCDPISGLCEFPPPGDAKYHTLPILKDPEADRDAVAVQQTKSQDKEYWMPDKFCKICFACEDSFTMYRRRHHCRICGQVFCNPCSSFYIDGERINLSGAVRACELCYKHLEEREALDIKPMKSRLNARGEDEIAAGNDGHAAEDKKKASRHEDYLASVITPAFLAGKIEKGSMASPSAVTSAPIRRTVLIGESVKEKRDCLNDLQYRASMHMKNIVQYLLRLNKNISFAEEWEAVIVTLIRNVVMSVDPDVRNGDKLDIRPFVKVKSIPGGSISDSAYVEGVVFRKNVAHKKMVYNKEHPKLLILSGGIEFHRQDYRLSSLDTLIDQEDKFLEIMVEKIMSLSPDIILVGKSVSRRAQELLTAHRVVVFQHVKERLLERIARMTHAMMLPSTDHMIQQFGKECLGSCGSFSLRQLETSAGGGIVNDSLMKIGTAEARPRITSTVTGTTYVYLEGCHANLGCTLVLRGARKAELKQVKQIIRFCVMVAYHLRLEVAYLADRCAMLPLAPDDEKYIDDSDSEELVNEYSDGVTSSQDKASENLSLVLGESGRLHRFLLSQSLDVDFGLPYKAELRVVGLAAGKRLASTDIPLRNLSPLEHQTLNISSILMSEGRNQRGRPEIKCIEYYTEQDVPLGQFIIESCFHMVGSGRSGNSKINMLEHTLCFVHRPGRIDIATYKADGIYGPGSDSHSYYPSAQGSGGAHIVPETEWELRDYLRNVQLKMASYCKVCQALVTPDVTVSDETWKMSFGKFLEMNFYNRSARCRTGGCSHCIRDNHVLFLYCDEGFIVRFEFHPNHPLTISLRQTMAMPREFHNNLNVRNLDNISQLKDTLVEDFRNGIGLIEKLAKEYLSAYPAAFEMANADISVVRKLVNTFNTTLTEDIIKHMNEILSYKDDVDAGAVHMSAGSSPTALMLSEFAPVTTLPFTSRLSMGSKFPSILKRDMYVRSLIWKQVLQKIHDYIEALRIKFTQLNNTPIATPGATPSHASSKRTSAEDVTLTSAGSISAPSTAKLEEMDAKAIRDLYMSDTAKLPIKSEEGLLDEAMDELEGAAIKFVLNPAMSTMRASVSTVVNIGQSAATMLSYGDSTVDASGSASAGEHQDRKSFSSAEAINATGGDDKKVTRISKLRTKLLGKEATSSAIGNGGNDLTEGRLGLEPGRHGIVLEVHEEELATVIAYSLASTEYEQRVQEYLMQAEVYSTAESTGDGKTSSNYSDKNETAARTADTRSSGQVAETSAVNATPPSPRTASVASLPGGRQLSTGSLAGRASTPQDSDNEDEQEGEVMDIHLTDDPLSAIAGERLGAAFAEGVDVSIAATSITRPSVASEVFGFSDVTRKDNEGPDEVGTFQKSDVVSPTTATAEDKEGAASNRSRVIEQRLSSQRKSHVKHRFVDEDGKGGISCKFICHTFWACQFEALRAVYLEDDNDEGFIRSLGASAKWQAQGGKSGASFSKTLDGRFVVKYITRTELQMFLDFAPAYFEYMQKVFYLGLPTILCKVLGVYQIGFHNRVTGKRVMEQVVVMENLFFDRNITRIFDLKGSARNRHVSTTETAENFEELLEKRRLCRKEGIAAPIRPTATQVLMDHNLMELTDGKPLPLKFKANIRFHKAILNDTLFLSIINVVDYSILVGIDEDTQEIVVGIIDYMRQYDIIKRMERMGKSVGMIAGQAEPTVIQPVQYRKRFVAAMDKYFMGVPDKWSQMK